MSLRFSLALFAPALLSAGAITGNFPTCSSLGNFGRLIGQTCQVGDFTISDAAFSANATRTSVPLTASQVGIIANQGASGVDFGISGPFNSPLGVTTTYRFDYLVDPETEVIITYGFSFDDSSSNSLSALAIGGSSIVARICAGAAFAGSAERATCRGFFAELVGDANSRNPLVLFPFATNIVDVNLVMTLQGGASINSVASRSGFTPEPRVGIIAGLGALALILRQRAKARQVRL